MVLTVSGAGMGAVWVPFLRCAVFIVRRYAQKNFRIGVT